LLYLARPPRAFIDLFPAAPSAVGGMYGEARPSRSSLRLTPRRVLVAWGQDLRKSG
jgi:hypothetical protein